MDTALPLSEGTNNMVEDDGGEWNSVENISSTKGRIALQSTVRAGCYHIASSHWVGTVRVWICSPLAACDMGHIGQGR